MNNRTNIISADSRMKKREHMVVYIITVFFVLLAAVIRYRSGEIDYHNSDATWHTLLTIEAYNETPASQHLFLPIVSLGKNSDKNIPWGEAVPDSKGNYYYTSFSPAGYFLPWLFIKCFRLDVSEKSLYLFNTFLLILSSVIWIRLLSRVYNESKYKDLLCFVGGITYIFAPEVLHGMGVVYWHQSILQVTLPAQILAYYEYAILKNHKYKPVFFVLSVLNPYIEWTGYVANVGFALAEIIRNRKCGLVKLLIEPIKIGAATILSFAIFLVHYLQRVDVNTFLVALKNRFMARNVSTDGALTDVFGGYYKSFLFIWVLLLCFLIWNFVKNKKIEISNGLLIFVITFPVLENVIMKEHAIEYTYDRMKAVFVLVFILCEVVRNLFESLESVKWEKFLTISLVLICAALNLHSYRNDRYYIWETDYREDNEILANYVTEQYPNALYAANSAIRGYMNLLWGRGIYEGQSIDSACALASSQNINEVVYINTSDNKITEVIVYDLENDSKTSYSIEKHELNTHRFPSGLQLADTTDQNWTNGCSNTANILLFSRNDNTLTKLLSAKTIIASENMLKIISVDYDDSWIRVKVDGDISACMYPAILKTE